MTTIVTLQFAPAGLEREHAAAYVGLSLTTFEKAVREGVAPQPRKLGDKRVVWLRAELEAWLIAAPVSQQLPPKNTGAPKPRPRKSATTVQPAAPSALQAA